MKKLFHVLPWPIAARLAALGMLLFSIMDCWLGTYAAEAMKKRGAPASVEDGIALGVVALLGLIGIRVFVWLCCAFWAWLAISGAIDTTWSVLDPVGAMWGVFWIALMLTPSAMTLRGEWLRRKMPNQTAHPTTL